MIEIDGNAHNQLVIIVEDLHRTTLSISHEDGLELHRKLTEHYGKVEIVARPKPKGWRATFLGR